MEKDFRNRNLYRTMLEKTNDSQLAVKSAWVMTVKYVNTVITVIPSKPSKNISPPFDLHDACDVYDDIDSHDVYNIPLLHHLQLVDNICSASEFINTPEHIANININGAIQVFVKCDLMTQRFIVPIECQADQFSFCIQHR
jgi:hypothetical protein